MTSHETTANLILGAGVTGLSLADFLTTSSVILEKDEQIGGLCRTYSFNGIQYDVGPHVLFSKNQQVLDFHLSIMKTHKIRRSNKIFHFGRLVKYPFENDLAALPPEERDYCLAEFLNNPYERLASSNMQQFFLKTFGEGITKSYLGPYNEKIWKFDPAYLDTQMVERIPKPPKEDVIKSAKGTSTEGYTHQLYFHYPDTGGFEELPKAYERRIANRAKIFTSTSLQRIVREGSIWKVETNKGIFAAKRLINCIPIHEFFKYFEAPDEIREALSHLKYNSMYTVVVQVKKDTIGSDFGYYIADPNIVFHRMVKIDFLGENYSLPGDSSSIMCEITYRPGSYLSSLSQDEIKKRTVDGLVKMGCIQESDVIDTEVRNFKYVYVIYDINHRVNTDKILNYLRSVGIHSSGRFAEFEYINSDQVVERTQKLAKILNEEK